MKLHETYPFYDNHIGSHIARDNKELTAVGVFSGTNYDFSQYKLL